MPTLFVNNSDSDEIKSVVFDILVANDSEKQTVNQMAVQNWTKPFGISTCNYIFSKWHIQQEPVVQKPDLNTTSKDLREKHLSIDINVISHHSGTENSQNISGKEHRGMNTDKKVPDSSENGSIENEVDVKKSITNVDSNSIYSSRNNLNVQKSAFNDAKLNTESVTSNPIKVNEAPKCEPISAMIPPNKQSSDDSLAEKTGNANSQVGPVEKEYTEKTCIDCSQKFPLNTKGQKVLTGYIFPVILSVIVTLPL